ncbi:hypothetical protein QQS21_002792 [Conoideocrella luteorostrata]|uniref:Homeobox and C2H2 transcription factor n=1 Tax=Conoideocrella luteorostrata TaxID=1105319 RepID=A0AAJ0CUH4_9HYPO|nr:hypothetical protein QQS21_002792 [Conoideocrella luteorostrata]
MSVYNLLFLGDGADPAPPPPPPQQQGADDNRRLAAGSSAGLVKLGDVHDDPPNTMALGSTPEPASALSVDMDWSDSLLFDTELDALPDAIAPHFPSISSGVETQDMSLAFPPPNVDHAHNTGTSYSQQQQQQQLLQPVSALQPVPYREAMEEFFAKNGAWRPREPCSYCRRRRLQCFILQTTDANPNPVNSCSSCVALFRNCSLAERSKRGHSGFETECPVIGHLHGVNEEDNPLPSLDQISPAPAGQSSAVMHMLPVTSKRSSSRSVRKTQILRDWFAINIHHPYPAEEEKSFLAEKSGLSRTQVINWFTNARRRHRLSAQPMVNNTTFPAGSPMPRSLLSSMSPFERWKHSPPDCEPVSEDAIQRAIGSTATASQKDSILGVGEGVLPAEDMGSSASTDSMLYPLPAFHYSSDGSLSNYSLLSASSDAVLSGRSSDDPGAHPAWVKSASARSKRSKGRIFTCTYCLRSFNKKYDWLRHERSVHAPGDTSWVCAIPLPPEQPHTVWRLGESQAECIFCGHPAPTEEHFQSHEFEPCAKRAIQDRSFTRKDHMWQHLYKFHGCRKWDGWKPDLNLLMHKTAVS